MMTINVYSEVRLSAFGCAENGVALGNVVGFDGVLTVVPPLLDVVATDIPQFGCRDPHWSRMSRTETSKYWNYRAL